MDLSSFLAGIRPLANQDYTRKGAALRSAFAVAGAAASTSFEDFVDALPVSITGACLGGDAEDFYLTTLLAAAVWNEPKLDPILGAVLNHIVLQLNFMTRFIQNPDGPESIVLDGDPRLFAVAMANGNVVSGLQVSEDESSIPAWALEKIDARINVGALKWCRLADVPATLAAIGRARIGCLFIQNQGNEVINIAQKYANLGSNLSQDTFYVIGGMPVRC